MGEMDASGEMAGGRHGGDLRRAATIVGCNPTAILDFSASLNPLGPPSSVLTAIAQAQVDICHYPDPQSSRLRQAIAHYYHLEPEWTIAGNGAAELFTWGGRDCAQLGSTLIPVPAFRDYDRALDTWNAPRELLPFWPIADRKDPSHAVDLTFQDPIAAIKTRLAAPNPPSCLIVTNPHNPTGQLWEVEQLLPLLSHFQLVIVDEAFMDFVCSPDDWERYRQVSLLPWVTELPQVVVVRSLTKFYAIAGLRVGFAVGHPDRLARWQQWRDPWSVNGLATVAAVAALTDSGFERRSRNWLATARPALQEGLAAVPGFTVFPSTANFLLVRSNRPVPPLQHRLLIDHHILIRDCTSFGAEGEFYFRVAVRTPTENQQLVTAIAAAHSNKTYQYL